MPCNVEIREGDVTDSEPVKSAVKGVDIILHLAALLHISNPSPSCNEKYERVNVGGTRNVIDAALLTGVKRLIFFFSTISVYRPSQGQILHEQSPLDPDTIYGHTKLKAERLVQAACRGDGHPLGTILRLGAVYGPGIKGNYRQLLKALAKGRFLPIENGQNRRTLVYDKDVDRAAVLAMEHPGAAGKIYNVSDGEFHTLNEITSAMCQALDRKPPCLSLPVRPVRFVADIVEDVTRWVGLKPPVMRATIDKYTEDNAVDLKAGGHNVFVITTVPHYNEDAEALAKQPLQAYWGKLLQRSEYCGMEVIHALMRRKGNNTLLRMLAWLGFHATSTLAGMVVRFKPDIVLAPSPPLTTGVSAWLLGLRHNCPFIYNVQEIYPDVAVNLGVLRNKFLIKKLGGPSSAA